MDRIASFSVNHLKLKPGLYLSRVDECNGVKVSTFDMRFTAPNNRTFGRHVFAQRQG